MYTFGARLLRAGHLSLPSSFAPYRPWASGVQSGHVLLKYTPVWPGVLAAGSTVGSMRVGVAVTAAIAVVLTGLLGREVFGRWTEGLVAAPILLLSPLFLVQAGTFLSYLFQLTLDLAIVLLVLGAMRRWPRDGRAPRAAVGRMAGAGAVWGIACFARQYDAVLIALPLVVTAVCLNRHSWHRLIHWTGWSALGSAGPLAALTAYNWVLYGSPVRSSFTITGANDTLLFGRRGVFPTTTFPFTPRDAVVSFVRNLTRLPSWTFGGFLLVALACFGCWTSRSRGAAVWAVAGIAASFTVGYALFWSPYSIVALWPGTSTLGPFYHLALLIPITLFGAAGLVALFERTRAGTLALVAVMLVTTAAGISTKIDRNRPITDQYQATKRLVEGARVGRAVLFMEDRGNYGFASAAPFLENQPGLAQPIVYAAESGPGDLPVTQALPGRTPFRVRSEIRPGDDLLHPTPFVERLDVKTAPAVALRFRIVNTVGAKLVVTHFRTAAIDRYAVLDTNSHKGKAYTFSWTLSAVPPPYGAFNNFVVLPTSIGTAEVQADFGLPGSVEHYELQYPYAVDGRQATVITPGWGRYLFQFAHVVWLNEDVAATLRQLP